MLCLYMNEKTAVRCHFFEGLCVLCPGSCAPRYLICSFWCCLARGAVPRVVSCHKGRAESSEDEIRPIDLSRPPLFSLSFLDRVSLFSQQRVDPSPS